MVLVVNEVDSLSAYVGYGNAAGFLMNRGLFSGIPASRDNESSKDGEELKEIDPVTGQIKKEVADPFVGMSDEDKERESEKLFVLFDRLNKTGVFQPINPFNLDNK